MGKIVNKETLENSDRYLKVQFLKSQGLAMDEYFQVLSMAEGDMSVESNTFINTVFDKINKGGDFARHVANTNMMIRNTLVALQQVDKLKDAIK